MKLRLTFVLCIVMSILILVSGCGKKEDDSTITLSYANFPPAPTFPCVQMERWADELEKRTNGKVVVNTYPGGTLLGARDMMDGVIAGQADIGCLSMAYQPGQFPITNATSLPLDIPNATVGSKVLWDVYKKYDPESFKDVKVITMFTTAPSNIMSKKPARTMDDLKTMTLRASGGAAAILGQWGANVKGMPMSEVPENLEKGNIEGLFTSVEAMKDFKYAELCGYVTMTQTSIYPFSVVMNMDTWNSLPADVQKVIDDLAYEQAVWTGEYMDSHVKESLAWSKQEHNVEVIELSPDQKQQWNQVLQPITDQWIQDAKGKGLPAEQILADIESLIAQHQK